jgi:DNA-binding response OmpR family regulator
VNREVPIIFLSAKTEEIDKVLGLELGADDYVMKPFGLREFVARIRAVSRRCLAAAAHGREEPSLVLGPVTVHPARLRAERGGVEIDLSLREVKLLQLFHDNPGKVLDRDTLFQHGWGVDHYPNSRTLDQHISTLRKKVESDPRNPVIIRTVHGVGYRYEG